MEPIKNNSQPQIIPENTNTLPASSFPTQSQSQPVETKEPADKKKIVIIAGLCALVLILAASTAYLFFQNRNAASSNTKAVPTQAQEVTTSTLDPIADWQTHSSHTFQYSFQYPSGWELLAYDEENPSVAYGANTLQNYSPVEIEKYMDHGETDWKSFLGDKPAIKIDFSIISKTRHNIDDLEKGLSAITANTVVVSPSQLQIGNLDTIQYRNSDPNSLGYKGNSFVAYIDTDRAIYVNLFYSNTANYEELAKSPEWQLLKQILSTFTFNKTYPAKNIDQNSENIAKEIMDANFLSNISWNTDFGWESFGVKKQSWGWSILGIASESQFNIGAPPEISGWKLTENSETPTEKQFIYTKMIDDQSRTAGVQYQYKTGEQNNSTWVKVFINDPSIQVD